MKTTKRKQVVRSKKIEIDGIQFASGLEGTMYKLLKAAGMLFEYEGKTYNIFEESKLETECWERATRRSKAMIDRRKVSKISYTPDFVGENEEWIIETKGRANESFPLRWKLFKRMVESWDKQPLIFKPTNKVDCEQVIKILKEKGYGKQN
jgi:uncharacterized protein YtpQ (UPF0354 family)